MDLEKYSHFPTPKPDLIFNKLRYYYMYINNILPCRGYRYHKSDFPLFSYSFWIDFFWASRCPKSLDFSKMCFPAKIWIELCPNPYEFFLQLVGLSPLWMSCNFSLSRDFSFSNQILINIGGIHCFSSPVEIRMKPLPQWSTFSDFHSEVNTSLKYTSWFNSEVFFLLSNVSLLLLFLSH